MMNIALCLAVLLVFSAASAQTITVGQPDATNYPTIRATVRLADAKGDPVSGATLADFRVTEDGAARPVTFLDCPPAGAVVPVSSALVLDISGSMRYTGTNGFSGLTIAQTAARAWIDNLDLNISECAVTSFDDLSFLNLDFTADRPALRNAVNGLQLRRGTSYTAALLTSPNGGIPVAARGKFKRVVILLTDGQDPRANANQAAIIAAANAANVTVYCITVRLRMPAILRNVAEQTGGQWYENVDTPEEAARIYRSILNDVQGVKPCIIEWQTAPSCDPAREAVVEWIPQNARDTVRYAIPPALLPQLTAAPAAVRLGGVPPGTFRDTTITLKTGATPVTITRLSMSSPDWSITAGAAPPDVPVPASGSHSVTVRYTAPDSLRSFSELLVESNGCIAAPPLFTAGFPRRQPRVKTLEVVHPNGGEELLVNADTVVKWKGVLPDEEVTLKYSTDKGLTWRDAAPAATGLTLPWRVPRTPSDSCLMLVAQYDPAAGLAVTIPHDDAVTDIEFSPDGQRVYTLTRKGEARQFSTQTGQLLRQYPVSGIRGMGLSPNEVFLAFVTTGGRLELWNPTTGILARGNGNTGFAGEPAFSANDSTLLVMFGGNTVFTATLTPATFGISSINTGIAAPVVSMRFTPAGTRFIGAGTTTRIARVWNFPTTTTVASLTHTASVLSAALAPDARKATTVDQNGRVKLWDVPTATDLSTLGTGYKTTAISADGKYALAGGVNRDANGLVRATLWNVGDGQFYRNLVGHTDTITAVAFSSDGRFAATGSSDNSVIIWDMAQLAAEIQSDTSDNLWKIVVSGVVARDVDMGRMQVGMSKDSVVSIYLENTGKVAVPVLAMSFGGGQAGEFSILSGDAPFVLSPGGKHAVEFSFTPANVGRRNATVNIQTPSETITQAITGEGIIVGLRAVRNVDFGKVFLGGKKDTLVQVILENTGTVDLTISGVTSDGPDTLQFSMLDAPAGFVLPAGQVRPMNLRFAPARLGRTTGQVVFAYPEPGSPEVSLLSGEGVCEDGGPATILTVAPPAEVNPGDTLTIPLLVRYPAGTLTSSDRQFSATVKYNGTVLTPLADSLRPATPRVQETMLLAGRQISPDTLTVLRFIAALGTSDTTALDVEGFTWELCAGSPLVAGRAITVKVCEAGGKRLYFPSQTAAMLAVSPNPATAGGTAEFSTPEDGRITLSILDMTGRTVATVFDEFARQGTYSAPLRAGLLPAGVYYLLLQTPTARIVRRLTVVR